MIILYLLGYELGAGPIPYIYLNDTCSDTGAGVGIMSMWIWCLVTCIISPFLLLNPAIGINGTFSGLAVCTFIGFVFCLFFLKETKGLTDDECKALYLPKQTKK